MKHSSFSRLFSSLVLSGLLFGIVGSSALASPTSSPPNGNPTPKFKNITVVGDAEIQGNLEVGQAVLIGQDLSVSGRINVTGDLNVGGQSFFADQANFTKDVLVDQQVFVGTQLNVEKDAIVGGQITAEGQANFGSSVIVAGDLSIEGSTNLEGDLVIEGRLTAEEETNFTKNVVIEGDLTVNGTINGMESDPQEGQPQGQPQGDDLTVEGQLFVKGQANFEQDIISDRQLSVAQQANFGADIIGNQQLTIAGQANLNGDAIINGQLFANKQANFKENVILSKDLIGPKAQLNEAVIGSTSDGLGTTIKQGSVQSITTSNAAIVGINQNVVNGNGGIKGVLRESFGDTVAWLGYKDSTGSVYSIFTSGITRTGGLISDREIYTNTLASTTGKINVQGGMTASDFGKFAFYTKTIKNGNGTAVAQKCLNNEILIACGGYSNQPGNYQGDVMYNNECTSMRSNTTGDLTVYAYCFDPRNLPY